jgi:Acyl-CoA reductase (LuxC)
MTTREAARHLSWAGQQFPFLGPLTENELLEVVRAELGDPEILDDFRPYGSHLARAIPVQTILHIISGNTPHAGLQSLIRGLLLQSQNLCKIPSAGLAEIDRFRAALPPELAGKVHIQKNLPREWIAQADAVIVFGHDQTIDEIRRSVGPHQRFIAHGTKVSLAVVFDDPGYESVSHAARDVSLFDQQGCLSPHLIYVRESAALSPQAYAEKLAQEMQLFSKQTPRAELSVAEAAAVEQFRKRYEFHAASDDDVQVWSGTDWTVIYEKDGRFVVSPLNRVVLVKPLPLDLYDHLTSVRDHLSAIGIWPLLHAHAEEVATLGASRICAIGRMQAPPMTWHQDAMQTLANLVRWVDFEGTIQRHPTHSKA